MAEQHIEIWKKTLELIKNQVNDQVYNAWFFPITPHSTTQDTIILEVPNEFFRDWVQDRYIGLLKSCLSEACGRKMEVNFNIVSGGFAPSPPETDKKDGAEEARKGGAKEKKGWFRSVFPTKAQEDLSRQLGLNPRYTFENFVIGPSNRFAHAASLAVVESPAKTYNPLFIYGGVGLGKTHLMQALAHKILEKNPRAKVVYISSEEFTNKLISAIQNRTTLRFREIYRNVDVLLIDDIQFIAGKEATQEEFFHTFNTLYDSHKQIVISSDRTPKEIDMLEERLVSRFEWGLVTDIQLPDFETRSAILKKKCEAETVRVPDEIIYFLAEKIKTNIRELEGALIRVVAYSKLIGKDVTLDLAKEVLGKMIVEGEKKINVDLIQKKVADYFNIKLLDMRAKKRTKQVVLPRQIAMYLSRDLTDLSLPEIGLYFGGRDHTTVLHACDKIEKDIKNNKETKEAVERLTADIRGY